MSKERGGRGGGVSQLLMWSPKLLKTQVLYVRWDGVGQEGGGGKEERGGVPTFDVESITA